MHLFYSNILIFMVSSTCFEPEGSSSGRRLYVQVRYNVFICNGTSSLVGGRVPTAMHVNNLYHTCTYIRLPEYEPSGAKHVEDIKKLKY